MNKKQWYSHVRKWEYNWFTLHSTTTRLINKIII